MIEKQKYLSSFCTDKTIKSTVVSRTCKFLIWGHLNTLDSLVKQILTKLMILKRQFIEYGDKVKIIYFSKKCDFLYLGLPTGSIYSNS